MFDLFAVATAVAQSMDLVINLFVENCSFEGIKFKNTDLMILIQINLKGICRILTGHLKILGAIELTPLKQFDHWKVL